MRELGSEAPSAKVAQLRAAVERTRRRLALRDWLRGVVRSLLIVGVVVSGLLLAFRLEWLSVAGLLLGGGVCIVGLLAITWRILTRAPSALRSALHLDRHLDREGQLAVAWELSGSEDALPQQAAFRRFIVEEAQAVDVGSAAGAVPLKPSGLAPRVLALGALLSAALFVPLSNDAPRAPQEPQPEAAVPQAWIADDDAELLQKAAQSVKDEVTSEPAREVVARFNDIVLRVVSGELSQHEALRLSAELQAELETANGTGRMLQEGLAERGRTLGEHNATRSIGEALAERRYSDAAEAMRRLSERLQADTKGLSEQELEELRASLEALRKDREQESTQSDESPEEREQRKALEKRRDELRKKSEQGSASAAERQELKETERRLKRLDRQKKRQQEAKQALSELDRQLAEAARALAEEKKKSGEFLDQAARSVKQAQKRVLSDEEKKQLIKRLQELKERLRRKREEGAREENLRDFQKRARGKKPGSQTGGEQKEGQQGQQGQQSLELELSQMSQSPVPGGTKPGQGNGEPEGRDAPTGDEPGSSHDPQLEGKESKLSDAQTTDVTAVAQDSGGGASESETIATAAEEGFTRGGYQKLFVEYRTVAEEIMERETIPPGRKAHVRRYFELIRPRENAPVRRKEE